MVFFLIFIRILLISILILLNFIMSFIDLYDVFIDLYNDFIDFLNVFFTDFYNYFYWFLKCFVSIFIMIFIMIFYWLLSWFWLFLCRSSMETFGLAVDVVAAAAPLASHAMYRTVSAANLLISGVIDLWGESVRIKSASCWQSGGKPLNIRYKLVQK